ncbi:MULTISPECIES: GerMN domain-containing protein [Bacteria]|uniref:GerMN domain-containing protein n=1 Tax=Bacteria TaxID=2 RepID=UPI003C7C52C9
MSMRRVLRGLTVVAVLLSLAGCASLPTSGDVRPGHNADRRSDDADVTYLPSGPIKDADPERIVRGFLEAASSPADNWAIARQFLTPELNERWKPQASVTIDSGERDRTLTAQSGESAEDGVLLRLGFRQTASVDDQGAYAPVDGTAGAAELSYRLTKGAGGQWRIAAAPDGVLLAEQVFEAQDVFSPYPLTFFDPSWTYGVQDVRWFPKRKNTATRIVQSLVSGRPSPWLAEAVRTAFTGEVELARDAVTVNAQIAEVDLTSSALGVDPLALARMRTQLESSLAKLDVTEVRLTVGGRPLEAGLVSLAPTAADTRPLVLTEAGFGHLAGGELTPVGSLSADVLRFSQPIRSIVVGDGARHAAVQGENGVAYVVGEGGIDELDARPGLLAPTFDPFGYVWTVPAASPAAVTAWSTSVVSHPVSGFADATSIGALAVSRDGARVAAAVTVGSHQRIVVAGVRRDDRNVPMALGASQTIGGLPGTPIGLAWLDELTVGVLVDVNGDIRLVKQTVGGTMTNADVPDDVRALSPMTPASTLRLLDENGDLRIQSGPTWRVETSGVRVLATQIDGF